MGTLLFLRRCFAYRYAACMEFQKARMLPRGPERNQTRRLARALRDLARDEAWLEGQRLRIHRNDALPAFTSGAHDTPRRNGNAEAGVGQAMAARWATPA